MLKIQENILGRKMYKCKLCGHQSKPRETQFELITKKRELDKGWEIIEVKKVCCNCWLKNQK